MENNQETILSEIREMISLLKTQLNELEAKVLVLENHGVASAKNNSVVSEIINDEHENDQVDNVDNAQNAGTLEEDNAEEVTVDFTSPVIDESPEFESTDLAGDSEVDILQEGGHEHIPLTVPSAVIDVMYERQTWRKDRPGSEVRDIRSAITLNDRVLFINSLFGEDALLFQDTLTYLNSLESVNDAYVYLLDKFPSWDFENEVVYRFMMAVRRKLR